jgi:hypothetical protein
LPRWNKTLPKLKLFHICSSSLDRSWVWGVFC